MRKKEPLRLNIMGYIYLAIILFIVVVTIITMVVRTGKAKELNSVNSNSNVNTTVNQ